MECNKSFVGKYQFLNKENAWKDMDSILSQNHLVGIFPINEIPSIEKKKQLENYGIPAGFVNFNHSTMQKGGANIDFLKNKTHELIDDTHFNTLFNLVSPSSNKQNKTKKYKKND